jgi:hypothetical protein
LTGALLVAAYVVVEEWVNGGFKETPDFAFAAIIAVSSGVVWAAGLIVIAALPWYVLHTKGYRGWSAAAVLGFALTFVTVMAATTNGFGLLPKFVFSSWDNGGAVWIDGELTAHGWANALQGAAMCGVAGAIAGLTVWRTAYRKPA